MTDFGARLKRLRKERDVTQAMLAEYIGVVPPLSANMNAYRILIRASRLW